MDRRVAKQHSEQRLRERRARVAQEAARIISEQGVRDYAQAKKKAADRLGFFDEASLPRNVEVEDALREHQRLFQHATQPQHLRARRETAVEAMRFFVEFEPRLVGAVLDGTADAHSVVTLHLFSDDALAPEHRLRENRIPFEHGTRRARYDRDRVEAHDTYTFTADGIAVELVVMPRDHLRQAPLDAGGERPMARATLSAVVALLSTS